MNKNASNSDKISENHIPGINRVVKLDIVIEGKIIKHFKHFRLQQSAKRHHNFELILAHDSLGKAQLQEQPKLTENSFTMMVKYFILANFRLLKTDLSCLWK